MTTYTYVMSERRVAASVFKAKCLALFDDVERTRQEIVVTKHGRPVARVSPFEPARSTMGSVQLVAEDDDAYFSTGHSWHAEA